MVTCPADMTPRDFEECLAILRYLSRFVGPDTSFWPTMKDLYNSSRSIFSSADDPGTFDAFRMKVTGRLKRIAAYGDFFGNAVILIHDGTKNIRMDDEYLDSPRLKQELKMKKLRYCLEERFRETQIPDQAGRDALIGLTILKQIQESVYLPSIINLDSAIEQYKLHFGIASSDKQLNPFHVPDGQTGRRMSDFVIYRQESISKIREQDESVQLKAGIIIDSALKGYLSGKMVNVVHGGKNFLFDLVACTALVKNGAVYLAGVIYNQKKKEHELNADKKLFIRALKIDRIETLQVTEMVSQFTRKALGELAFIVTSNDGAFLTGSEKRIHAVLKVNPNYRYFEESLAFTDARRLSTEELQKIGQPKEASCYLVRNTNDQHLVNEVIKSRGNVIVLGPSEKAEMVAVEAKRMLEALTLHEPIGIAQIQGAPRLPGADHLVGHSPLSSHQLRWLLNRE